MTPERLNEIEKLCEAAKRIPGTDKLAYLKDVPELLAAIREFQRQPQNDHDRLYAPKQATDEVFDSHLNKWALTETAFVDGFNSKAKYRRPRHLAWLDISKVPVQYPAWLLHNKSGLIEWFSIDPISSPINWTHWQPAPPAPKPPVDGSLAECDRLWKESQHWSDVEDDRLKNAAIWGWNARGEFERSKGNPLAD